MRIAGFYIVYALIWMFTLLPLRALYLISDLMYQLVYHVIGYRKKVVYDNLRHAFPEKNEMEITVIAKGFYRHFCDFLLESVKTLNMDKKQVNRHFKFENVEIFDDYYRQGRSIVLISGHYGNWEWMVDFPSKVPYKTLAIYKPLQDEKFDHLIREIREKYASGSEMVAMNDVYRRILEYERMKQPIITWFLGDQSPPKDYPLWISFMNRETPFYSGPEKVARKFGHAVIFMDVQKISRGKYSTRFIPLFDDPKNTQENEITRKHVQTLEEIIRRRPEYWLWSHRRWKHSRDKK